MASSPGGASEESGVDRTASRRRAMLGILSVSVVAYGLLQGLVVPALPVIQRRTHACEGAVTWVYTAFLVSSAVTTPILGRMGDIFGKVKILQAALLAAIAGVVLAAVTGSIDVLIAGRAVQGVIGAAIPLAFAIVRDEVAPEKVVGTIGFLSGLLAAAVGVGVCAGGPITEHLGYVWLFWIPMVMILVACATTRVVARETGPRSPGSISWSAAGTLSLWLVTLLVFVSEGQTWGWISAPTVALIVATLVAVVAWVSIELRAREPLIDIRLLRSPTVWTANLVIATAGVAGYATFVLIPEFVQAPSSGGFGFGASTSVSGAYLLPQTLAIFAAGLLAGPLTSAIGFKMTSAAGAAISLGGVAMLAAAHSQSWQLLVESGLLGVGFGFVLSATSAIVVKSVPEDQTGAAAGMSANIRIVGGAIGTQVAVTLLTVGRRANSLPTGPGYSRAFTFLAVSSAIAVVVAIAVPGAGSRRMRTITQPTASPRQG